MITLRQWEACIDLSITDLKNLIAITEKVYEAYLSPDKYSTTDSVINYVVSQLPGLSKETINLQVIYLCDNSQKHIADDLLRKRNGLRELEEWKKSPNGMVVHYKILKLLDETIRNIRSVPVINEFSMLLDIISEESRIYGDENKCE